MTVFKSEDGQFTADTAITGIVATPDTIVVQDFLGGSTTFPLATDASAGAVSAEEHKCINWIGQAELT